MFVSLNKDHALFRSPYDEKFDFIRMFRGISLSPTEYNSPVDFMATGFMKKEKIDCWHIDFPLSFSTDESPGVEINGGWIGANHGVHQAIKVHLSHHGLTTRAVGSLWKDEKNVLFTLLRVKEGELLFLSENKNSEDNYAFFTTITGALQNLETKEIFTKFSQTVCDLQPSIRHLKKKVFAWRNGEVFPVFENAECDFAEIVEEYEIISPATVAQTVRNRRPQDGYASNPSLEKFGKPMLRMTTRYQVLEDGTLLCHFNHKKLLNVHVNRYMGAMYQEKIDAYRGGIKRYIPKIKPFETPEGSFDFSTPYPLEGKPFPSFLHLTKNYWSNENSPAERMVDYFYDETGKARLGFACGYLPLYDGAPNIRRNNLTHTALLYKTRKAYPTFLSGDLQDAQGLAYKKYFPVFSNAASWYTVQAEGKIYLYADFFAKETLNIPLQGRATLLEKSEKVVYKQTAQTLTITAPKGYAVFEINP